MIQDELDKLWAKGPRMHVSKAIILGDLHLGIRDNADDFDGHDSLFLKSIFPYIDQGFDLLLGGDIYDDWECPDRSKIRGAYPEIWKILKAFGIFIPGNHDNNPRLPLGNILILNSGKEMLWTHGHVGDFFNSQASWLGKFFVRYIWRNLQMTGIFKDPTTATIRNPGKHERTKEAFLDWAKTRNREVVYHHTHCATEGPAWNAGSWVGIGGQAVVIDGNKIEIKHFV